MCPVFFQSDLEGATLQVHALHGARAFPEPGRAFHTERPVFQDTLEGRFSPPPRQPGGGVNAESHDAGAALFRLGAEQGVDAPALERRGGVEVGEVLSLQQVSIERALAAVMPGYRAGAGGHFRLKRERPPSAGNQLRTQAAPQHAARPAYLVAGQVDIQLFHREPAQAGGQQARQADRRAGRLFCGGRLAKGPVKLKVVARDFQQGYFLYPGAEKIEAHGQPDIQLLYAPPRAQVRPLETEPQRAQPDLFISETEGADIEVQGLPGRAVGAAEMPGGAREITGGKEPFRPGGGRDGRDHARGQQRGGCGEEIDQHPFD